MDPIPWPERCTVSHPGFHASMATYYRGRDHGFHTKGSPPRTRPPGTEVGRPAHGCQAEQGGRDPMWPHQARQLLCVQNTCIVSPLPFEGLPSWEIKRMGSRLATPALLVRRLPKEGDEHLLHHHPTHSGG